MGETAWRMLQLVVWMAVALAFYFSNNMTTGDSIAKLNERMSVNETVVRNETTGYRILQEELARRMERMEVKIDNLSIRIDNANTARLETSRHGGAR